MSVDQIYISATRYSSPALHGDAHWRAIKLLPQQQPGQYTATVDGRRGVISIDAKGWWFTEQQTAPTPTAPEVAPVTPPHTERRDRRHQGDPAVKTPTQPSPDSNVPFIKLDAAGQPIATPGEPHSFLVVTAANLVLDVRAEHRGSHASCEGYAAQSQQLDRTWRLASLQELFNHVLDHSRFGPACDRTLFPHFPKSSWIWSSTADASDDASSPVCAWGVYLDDGDALIRDRDDGGLALPVAAWAASASQS